MHLSTSQHPITIWRSARMWRQWPRAVRLSCTHYMIVNLQVSVIAGLRLVEDSRESMLVLELHPC